MNTQPNVVVVLTDDQGYGDLSCHGNPILKTPCIDKIYHESIRLNDFHVAPMCTPTRSQLMSGQDALRNGATYVNRGKSLLNPKIDTMADLFLKGGYSTAHFGKWHLGDNYPYRPQDRGFQETVHHPAWGITSAPDYFGNDYFDDYYRHNDTIQKYFGYCTDVWFELATNWISNQQNSNQPFFTYIATNAPHVPLWVPDKYRQPFLQHVDYDVASFYGMIANIDENIGKLDKFLNDSALLENTILIFMGDNGTATADKVFNAGMRGRKTSLYEGGHRVPCFIRWPNGNLIPPQNINEATQCQDILPTLIDFCALEKPTNTKFDGLSLASRLQKGKQLPDRMLVVQYGHSDKNQHGSTWYQDAAVIWNNWRLVDNELFDIKTDPAQKKNIAKKNPTILSAMRDFYSSWWNDVGDNLNYFHPITIGSNKENPTKLSSCDWQGVSCDNPKHIRGQVMDSGIWNLDVSHAGTYSFSLFRWPEESLLAICDRASEMRGKDGSLQEGVSFDATHAEIIIGNYMAESLITEGALSVTFNIPLKKGPLILQTWWKNIQGERLAGAYYVSVKKVL